MVSYHLNPEVVGSLILHTTILWREGEIARVAECFRTLRLIDPYVSVHSLRCCHLLVCYSAQRHVI